MPESLKTVTKIETQKRNKNRLSIYLEDEFAFGVDASVAAKASLNEGAKLSQSDISRIILAEEKKHIREKAFRYLANRAHSEKELRDKLLRKGFDENAVAQVLENLSEQNFLDDKAFAFAYAKSRIANKCIGPRLLRHELWKKGVAKKLIETALKEVYSDDTQEALAARLAAKKKHRYADLGHLQQKKRLVDFLLRRGFEWEVVKEVVGKELNDGE